MLYYPWINENELILGFKTHDDSYKHKQHLNQEVANKLMKIVNYLMCQ